MNDEYLTPEYIERAIKLEGIFMPIARKKRDEHFNRQPATGAVNKSSKFVHYTSAEAGLKIIRSKRLWMRNAMCMSDYSEVKHGFQILWKFFQNESKKAALADALHSFARGVLNEALDLFDQHWKTNTQAHTYVTSISEHLSPSEDVHGRLSMWRAFGGGNVARVGIVLNIPWSTGGAMALNLMFSPVAYLTEEEAHATLEEATENIRKNADYLCSLDRQIILNYVFTMLLAGVTCLKHEGFREEREWRAIYSPYRAASPLMESSIEVVGGVPQIVYKIPIDQTVSSALAGLDFSNIFDRIIVGPSPYPFPIYDAFRTALIEAGIHPDIAKERVFTSGIPIRV